ncbi:uncharacterized protein A4U43_C07F34010 [Asparagus officinalis]|uniref:Nuclear pore complex protein NUP1 n=1 Tax=Asparagus officinalis TaxID=4686 RepID=A0A5P1EGY3_ASPOF|nr:uncharacterized protein A4U43_C07F34010 [Asparagus officinalis]
MFLQSLALSLPLKYGTVAVHLKYRTATPQPKYRTVTRMKTTRQIILTVVSLLNSNSYWSRKHLPGKVESDRLAELLRSRMVETANVGREKEKDRVLVQDDGIGSSRIHSHKDEAGSPEELAKAYMGSRPSKVLSVGKYDNQVFQEDAHLPNTPSTSKRLDLLATPRSGIRFSGIPEQSERGYRTERPPGRSAIYRMSRSPYFKVNPTTSIQVGGLSRDGSSCQWTPSAMKLHGRQSLKRGSAALDGEVGSVGPIRRIRQKSGLLLSSKVPHSSLSGKIISNHSTPAFKDVLEGSTSVQKTLLLDERKYVSLGSEAAENGISSATMIPLQSSETAQKLFQQLDKLLPSPKEKSAEPKMIARDESPSKLTLGMLHGSALRSMEDIPSKFFTVEGHGQIGTSSASPNIGSSHSLKLDMVKENGPDSVSLGMKSASEANGVSNVPIPSEYVKHGVRSENIAIARNVGHAVPKKPAFQMSAPEDSFELDDDDDDNLKDSSVPLTTAEDDGDTKTSKQTNIISERVIPESPTTSSQGMPVSSSESLKKADKKPVITPVVTEKSNGFAFPVSSDPFSQFQSPPTPTMAIPQSDGPEALQPGAPSAFQFGGNQNLSFPQNPSPFQPTANVEFTAGGSFSLGSGGGDKSGRRYVKVKRDKLRRK